MSQTLGSALGLASRSGTTGVPLVQSGGELTRLHYFDGKFLRAADLDLEQRYVQALVHLSNQAGGPGIVHGFSAQVGTGDTLSIGAGLAIDPQGRVLLLSSAATVPIADLLAAAGRATAPVVKVAPAGKGDRPPAISTAPETIRSRASAMTRTGSPWVASDPAAERAREAAFQDCAPAAAEDGSDRLLQPSDLYLIVIAHAEQLCGHEDVYGRLCEAACTTRSERPYFVEGVVVLAIPLGLDVTLGQIGPIVLSVRHLRSRVASAYYAREAREIAGLISKEGLASETWCLGAEALGGFGVPIGVLARSGSTTTFFDPWIARRERMEAPPRKYWAWRMAMRPWDVFLAQILQFQCQLHDLFTDAPPAGTTDPCGNDRKLIDEASGALTNLREYYRNITGALARLNLPDAGEITKIDTIKNRLEVYNQLIGRLDVAKQGVFVGNRVLIRGGILELPSAGYLPVARTSELSVNAQVRNLLGEGVDLRFCVVRPDFVPHALEEAQHMERISLVQGLANAQDRPQVDILVPNGEVIDTVTKTAGMGFAGTVQFATVLGLETSSRSIAVTGAGRGEILASGGVAFHYAGVAQAPSTNELGSFVRGFDNFDKVLERGAFAGITAKQPVIPEGLFRVREAVNRLAPTRIVGFEDGAVRGTVEGIPSAVLPSATTGKLTAVWATLRSEEDPFGLQVGQETQLDGRIVVVVPASRVSLVDVTIRGALRVTDVTPGTAVTDRCRGIVMLDVVWTGQTGTQPVQQHYRLEATIELTRVERTDGDLVTAKLAFSGTTDRKTVLELTVPWSGSPVTAKAEGRLGIDDKFEPVLRSELHQSPDVFNAGNTEHDLAMTALEVIAVVLAEPAFKAHAQDLLFPPAKAPTREQTLRATLDWVLFHRRRQKECGPKEVGVPVKNRRFKVYAGTVDNVELIKPLLDALRKNDAAVLKRGQFKPVGIVEYGGGSPNLLTPATTLADQWSQVAHGNQILLAAIASRGDALADGQPLSLARLKQLEVALDPIGLKTSPQAVSEMLASVPEPTLPADDTDGIIVILSERVVDIRHARVVLYRSDIEAGLQRQTSMPNPNTPGGVVEIPDLTVLFRDHALVEDEDAKTVFETLRQFTFRDGQGADRLELATRATPDAQASTRASAIAAFLRRQVSDAAGRPYLMLKENAPVATRRLLDTRPDERPFLSERGRDVDEIVALTFGIIIG